MWQPSYSVMWLSRVAVPGRDLPDDSLWQVDEAEVMTVDDYDTIVERGWWPFLMGYMPRVIDAAEIQAHFTWMDANLTKVVQRVRERGYVPISSGGTTIPFECLCGGRSMQEFYLDLHRIPDNARAVQCLDPVLLDLGVAREGPTQLGWILDQVDPIGDAPREDQVADRL